MDHENYATFASNAQELTPCIDVILPDTSYLVEEVAVDLF